MAQFLSQRFPALKSRPARLAGSALLLAVIGLAIWLVVTATAPPAGALPVGLPVLVLRRAGGQRRLPVQRRRRLHRLRGRLRIRRQLPVERSLGGCGPVSCGCRDSDCDAGPEPTAPPATPVPTPTPPPGCPAPGAPITWIEIIKPQDRRGRRTSRNIRSSSARIPTAAASTC